MCKISIAIPVYNDEKNIYNSILSCVNQKYKLDYEIIVVDNNSTDGTLSILNIFADRVRIVRNTKKISMYENHNVCLEKSTGDYVLFCHSDDKLRDSALNILHSQLSKYDYPEKFVVWGRSFFRDFELNYSMGGGELNKVLSGINSVKPFLYGGVTPSGTCYSRISLLSLGGFLKCNHRLAPADWTTMMMLALEGFEFKMVDRLIFERTFASTLVVGAAQSDVRESLVDAIATLRFKFSKEQFDRLIEASRELELPPLCFYYACVKNEIMPKKIKNILIKKMIKSPRLIQNELTRKIFFGRY